MIKINPKRYISENFITEKNAIKIARQLQANGKKIGLCTGSFDLLHPGQIAHLIEAKKFCDFLFIAIARNKFSSSKNPGSGRPIFSDVLRAYMISQLKPVDYVFLDYGLVDTVMHLKPNVYIKGKDYSDLKEKRIRIQKRMMKSLNGKIIFTKSEKLSTTEIIKHIKEKIKI